MLFDFIDAPLAGLKLLRPMTRPDARGSFTKLFHAPTFEQSGLTTEFPEQYITISRRDVLRGMHFQRPPDDHAKIVYCVQGSVLDVVLDIRKSSPTYGKTYSAELNGDSLSGIYIPKGFAHGFLTLTEEASLLYLVETVHAPQLDAGIHWSSFGFEWPATSPLTSQRDANLPQWDSFISDF